MKKGQRRKVLSTETGFNYSTFEEEAIEKLRQGHGFLGPEGALTGLIKHLLEKGLNAEIDAHLSEEQGNRRNGYSQKELRTGFGPIEIQPPRDRNGTFEPVLVPKRERYLTPEIERQIMELYSIGNSYRDIREHLEKLYGVSYSESQISQITERIWEEVVGWQQRALQTLYAFVFLDAIHYKVREEGEVKTKAVYTVLGVDMEGNRDVLGIYVGQAEGAKTWARILQDIKDRGVADVLFFSVDGLKGFGQAISSIYPESIVQQCIVHMVRNCMKYVNYGDYKAITVDLRKIYGAGSIEEAELALTAFGDKWDNKYPEIRKKWEKEWIELTAYFTYPKAIRRVIYTTNAVESLHRHMRKTTKTKGAFVSEKALIKQLYLTLQRTRKSWARTVHHWSEIYGTLQREFKDRIERYVVT